MRQCAIPRARGSKSKCAVGSSHASRRRACPVGPTSAHAVDRVQAGRPARALQCGEALGAARPPEKLTDLLQTLADCQRRAPPASMTGAARERLALTYVDLASAVLRRPRAHRYGSSRTGASGGRFARHTIVDFENGSRTPIASNLVAIRAALEEDGVSGKPPSTSRAAGRASRLTPRSVREPRRGESSPLRLTFADFHAQISRAEKQSPTARTQRSAFVRRSASYPLRLQENGLAFLLAPTQQFCLRERRIR